MGEIASSPGRGRDAMDLGRFSLFWMTDPATYCVAAAATARCPPGLRSRPIQLPAAPSTTEDLQQKPVLGAREEAALLWSLLFLIPFVSAGGSPHLVLLSEKTLQVSAGATELRKPTSSCLLVQRSCSEQTCKASELGARLLSSQCCTQRCPGGKGMGNPFFSVLSCRSRGPAASGTPAPPNPLHHRAEIP